MRFFRNFDLDSGGKVDFSFGTFYIKNYMRLKCFMSAKDCAKREIFFYNWRLNILYRANKFLHFAAIYARPSAKDSTPARAWERQTCLICKGIFFAYFISWLESVMSLGKLRMGYIGGKKFYILRKKFYRLICVRKNQKNVGFWKKSARKILFVEILFLCVGQKKYLFAAESCS